MDAVSLVVHLVFKTFFLALPVGVAWLAFRRLSMSESRNAWLYSAIGLFASFAAAGLAPWAFGFTGASWVFLLFSLLSPPLWLVTVVLCDLSQSRYDNSEPHEIKPETFHTSRAPEQTHVHKAPLVLNTPVETVAPLFRHSRPTLEPTPLQSVPKPEPAPVALRTQPSATKRAPTVTDGLVPGVNAPRKVLDVARDMRGDGARHLHKELVTADGAPSMPFLRGTG